MKKVFTAWQSTISKQASEKAAFGPRRAVAVLSFLSIFPGLAFASAQPTATVRLYNFVQASPATIASAEREAATILAAAGVQVAWIDCLEKNLAIGSRKFCDKGWRAEIPSMRLLPGHVTSQFQDLEFGFASIPAYAAVSYAHIEQRAIRDNFSSELPVIMGCVMAHELGHLLLGDPSHSSSGIMQPLWGRDQIRQALIGGLKFTKEQASRLQKNVRLLEDHWQETSSYALISSGIGAIFFNPVSCLSFPGAIAIEKVVGF